MQIWKAWFRCFSRTARASLASWILPHSSWDGLSMPEEGVATTVVLHFQEVLAALFSSADCQKKPAHTFRSHIVEMEIEARERQV